MEDKNSVNDALEKDKTSCLNRQLLYDYEC